MRAALSSGTASGTSQVPRQRHDMRLMPAAITVWVSALLGLLWGWWAGVAGGALGVAIALALFWSALRRRAGPDAWRRGTAAGALFLCGLLTAGPMSVQLFTAEHDPLRMSAARGGEVTLRATVAQRPRPLRSAGYAGRPGGARSFLVPVDVEHAAVAGRPVPSTGRVLLIAAVPEWSQVLPRQQVTVHGTLAPAREHELTVAVVFVSGPPEDTGTAPWWQQAADTARRALRSASGVLGEEAGGLLPGLIVGDTSELSGRIEQDFLVAGMSHLTAVSGFHVAVVCGAVLLLTRGLRLGPRLSAAIAAVTLVGFVVLVGYEPSVLRAGVMGAISLLALLLGRRGSALPALGAAVCVLVLYDPAMATNMGFALSVVATAGLVLLAPKWAEGLVRTGVPAGLAEGLVVPAAAFLATAPVLAGMTGEVSLVSVAANLLAAPVVAPVMVLGAVATVLAPIWPAGAGLLLQIAGPGVSWLIFVARNAAGVPGAIVSWPSGWWGGLLAAGVAGLLVLMLRSRRSRALLALALGALLMFLVPVRIVAPSWPPENWVLVACDVGQGDGIVLTTEEPGRAVVVDTGPEPVALGGCLDRLNITRVPLVVLSHLHADHIGGLQAVFDGRAVGAVAVGPGRVPGWAWRKVESETAAQDVPLLELRVGDRFGWPGLRLDVLGPRHVSSADDGTAVNNSSVVLRATTPAGRVLLTGDIELAAQADLLASGADLRAEILKIPHHGSRFSLPLFLATVAPRIAVVSAGEQNEYGHPHHSIVRMLRDNGALVARTDTGGDTAVVIDDAEPAVVRRGPVRRGR